MRISYSDCQIDWQFLPQWEGITLDWRQWQHGKLKFAVKINVQSLHAITLTLTMQLFNLVHANVLNNLPYFKIKLLGCLNDRNSTKNVGKDHHYLLSPSSVLLLRLIVIMLEIKIMIGIYYCHLSCLVPRWSPPEILLFKRVLIMSFSSLLSPSFIELLLY